MIEGSGERTGRRLGAALAAALVLSACGAIADVRPAPAAQHAEKGLGRSAAKGAPPTENGVYIARGICFGEGGCPYENWRAPKRVDLRERPNDNAAVVAAIAPGEWVKPVEGQMRLIPWRGVVRKAGQGLKSGEVVYMLEPTGEGDFTIWRRGAMGAWQFACGDACGEIEWDTPGPDPQILGWWVRIAAPDGRIGWVRNPEFECMGPLAGDENCRG